jgi:hypothetical protein
MAALTAQTAQPLTLSEQLDAMLLGWLERRADRRAPGDPRLRATAVLTIADNAMAEVRRFCGHWGMTVERPARGTVAVIKGPALAVEGFTEITAMYRR